MRVWVCEKRGREKGRMYVYVCGGGTDKGGIQGEKGQNKQRQISDKLPSPILPTGSNRKNIFVYMKQQLDVWLFHHNKLFVHMRNKNTVMIYTIHKPLQRQLSRSKIKAILILNP